MFVYDSLYTYRIGRETKKYVIGIGENLTTQQKLCFVHVPMKFYPNLRAELKSTYKKVKILTVECKLI